MALRNTVGPGTSIGGRYVILEKLTSGGQGFVYKARDSKTEKLVAVKLFGVTATIAFDRLMLEARVAARASSENIVSVSDVGIDSKSGCAFLVMEFLHGLDLERLVTQEGPCTFGDVVEYLRQAASGLDKAHAYQSERGVTMPIIHRDLKPANLFLTRREDGTKLIKILDFGIAKQLVPSSDVMSLDIKGTPRYMAPEQFLAGQLTAATDTWALGLIAFFLLTGQTYWKAGRENGSSHAGILEEVLSNRRDPPRKRIEELGLSIALPHAFDAWFLRCVARDPARRFQSAGDAVRELRLSRDLSNTTEVVTQPFDISLRLRPSSEVLSNRATQHVTLTLQPSPSSKVEVWSLTSPRRLLHRQGISWIVSGSLGLILGGSAASLITMSQHTDVSARALARLTTVPVASASELLPPAAPEMTAGWSGAAESETRDETRTVESKENIQQRKAARLSIPTPAEPPNTASRTAVGQSPKTQPKLPLYPWQHGSELE